MERGAEAIKMSKPGTRLYFSRPRLTLGGLLWVCEGLLPPYVGLHQVLRCTALRFACNLSCSYTPWRPPTFVAPYSLKTPIVCHKNWQMARPLYGPLGHWRLLQIHLFHLDRGTLQAHSLWAVGALRVNARGPNGPLP